jgi:hypothetical protein
MNVDEEYFTAALTALALALHRTGALGMHEFHTELANAAAAAGQRPAGVKLRKYAERLARLRVPRPI